MQQINANNVITIEEKLPQQGSLIDPPDLTEPTENPENSEPVNPPKKTRKPKKKAENKSMS